MLFSEEINNARKYGYSFIIKRGYLFDKDFTFSEYVLDLYKIKESHDKSHPLYAVSKLLLNSLYGRFGMDVELQFTSHRVVDNNDLFSIIENNTVKDVIELEDTKSLISVIDDNKMEDSLHDTSSSNISVALASAVCSYGRIFMSQVKMKYKDQLYYSDTDSIFLDCDLDQNLIGKGLGQ
jgi:hypothetical protein